MSTKEKQSLFYRFIKGIEVVGNKIPHPFYMFLYLAIAVLVLEQELEMVLELVIQVRALVQVATLVQVKEATNLHQKPRHIRK